jgi:hypothetical protein
VLAHQQIIREPGSLLGPASRAEVALQELLEFDERLQTFSTRTRGKKCGDDAIAD